MELVSLGFVVAMVLVGGVVALIADNLGRTIGKKRLTFLHLRPRHTATLFTVGAGMLIPFVTVLAIAIVSADARRWLAEGSKAIQERDAAVASRDAAVRDREAARTDAEQQRLEAQRRRTENDRLIKDSEQRRKKIVELESRSKELVADVRVALSDLKKANNELRTTDLLRADAVEKYRLAQSNLTQVQGKLATLDLSYREIDQQFRELISRNQDLDRQNSALERDSDRLKGEISTLETEKRISTQRLETTKLSLDEARSELERAGSTLAAMQQMLSRNLDASRRNPLIFGIGEELARIPFPPSVDPADARNLLAAIIRQASTNAIDRGARQPDGAGLYSRFVRTTNPPRELSVAEQIDTLVERLASKPEAQLLVAISALNAFQGEFVALDMHIVPNPVVFKKGDVVAEVRLNGNDSESAIYRQLQSFLVTTVAPKAIKSGVLPILGRGNASIPVTEEELSSVAKSIHSQDRSVRLVAHAAAETRAAGPLELQFRVR